MIDTSRHRNYFNPRDFDTKSITIIGAGATGSRVFEALVNLGLHNIQVYDFDEVEPHNLANQIYQYSDIGNPKVVGLENWHHEKTTDMPHPAGMAFNNKKVEGNMKSDMGNVVFLLTDTMESRREIWKHSLWLNPSVETVIETRMALTHGDIYQFNPNVASENRLWNESLIEDDEAEMSACGTALSVHSTACIIANLAVNSMMHWMLGEPVANHSSIYLHPLMINTTEWRKSDAAA